MSDASSAARAEFNLCGVLVHARPQRMPSLKQELAALPGVEVHREAPDGRLVITVEDTPEAFAADILSQIHVLDGVLSAALVYHHCERGDETPVAPA